MPTNPTASDRQAAEAMLREHAINSAGNSITWTADGK